MTEQILIKSFKELSLEELYELLKLRSAVFVVEQDCVYQDLDDKDQESNHLLLFYEEILVAYCRILRPGLAYPDHSSIGRVVAHPQFRKKGWGILIMNRAIQYCRDHFKNTDIKISAQCYLDQFYQGLGFEDTGDHYLEDGIPHQAMILKF